MDSSKFQSNITKIIIFLSSIIAVISVYILLTVDLPNKPLAGRGGAPDNDAQIGGDFILTDHRGNEFNSNSMKGRLSLVYFGFTFCPDICPTSLQKLTHVLSVLDKYQIEILPIFITLDPKRDTSSLLSEYLGHFHKNFIGLTGSKEQIENVASLYKVYYAIAGGEKESSKNYMLDHSSFVYLMDKNGKYMTHFHIDSSEEEIIEYVRVHK